MNGSTTIGRITALALGASLLAAAPSTATTAGTDYGYGFYRTVEGRVLLTGLEKDAEPLDLEPNYPLLTGDRIWVAERGRLEAVLPDKSIIRIAEGTEVFFESLAGSSDGEERASTVVRLLEGELQLVADGYVDSVEPALIATLNADVYLDTPGTYRVTSDGRGWTEVVVRSGWAEVTTDRGSTVARSGDRIVVDGERRPEVAVLTAGSLDELERWGAELSGDVAAVADLGYVDESLAYTAAPLARGGAWLSVSGQYAWRPTVRVGWRPYYDGWWVTTPSGLSWVAYEPWGWVTSHYGAWDYVPGYGWLWFPGAVYSPAWVYWYWGPTHVGWIPAGYYTRFYGPRFGFGFHFGVYGWAGGYWDGWLNWTFCPSRYFGRRSYRPYWRSGHELSRDRRLRAVPRGMITNDTRALHRGHFGKPTEIYEALQTRAGRAATTRELPDVSGFVARRTELPEATRRAIQAGPAERAPAMRRSTQRPVGGATMERAAAAPWAVDRPVRAPSRRQVPDSRDVVRRQVGTTDWDLVERLRRFETKHETMPRSPRAVAPEARSFEPRRAVPPTEVPTRRILDGIRSRTPQRPELYRRPSRGGSEGRSVRPPATQRRPPRASAPSSGSSARGRSMSSSRPSSGRPSGVSRPSGSSRPSSSARSSSGSGSSSRSRPRGRPRGN